MKQELLKPLMKKGDVKAFVCNNILVQNRRDKKVVRMISTAHNHETLPVPCKKSNEIVEKPTTVLDYNKHARGIDQGDMMMNSYFIKRKSSK
jgi:hypothetical protein